VLKKNIWGQGTSDMFVTGQMQSTNKHKKLVVYLQWYNTETVTMKD